MSELAIQDDAYLVDVMTTLQTLRSHLDEAEQPLRSIQDNQEQSAARLQWLVNLAYQCTAAKYSA